MMLNPAPIRIRVRVSLLAVCAVAGLLAAAKVEGRPGRSKDAPNAYHVFGAGWTADSLANLEIGRFQGRMVSYRFRAARSGPVRSVRVYFIFRKLCDGCYANGDGGKIRIEITEDDGTANHQPSNKVLASALVKDPLKEWNRLVEFESPAHLERERLYHIVFSNLVADARQNYVSIDDLYTTEQGNDLQPSAQASDLAVLLKSAEGAGWQVKIQHVPIISINYQDGYQQGQGYMDVKHNAVVVKDGEAARESFEFHAPDRAFEKIAVRVEPMNGRGRVRVDIEIDNGKVLRSTEIDFNTPANQPTWETWRLTPPLTLKEDTRYSLVLTAEGGAAFQLSPLQKGKQYGFDVDSLLGAGYCEIKTGSSWTGCLSRRDLDLPFYFE